MTRTPAAETPAPRLDVWLADQRTITRHAARTLIDAGFVTVNGRRGRPGQRMRERDVVDVADAARAVDETGGDGASRRRAGPRSERRVSREPSGGTPAGFRPRTRNHLSRQPPRPTEATAPLDIVYEDDWLAVVDKAAGMVVHPAPGHPSGTLADALKERGAAWSLLGGEERAGIVHRLDRDTSGLLVVAKSEAAHRALALQLRDRTLGRTYWAVVRGGFREATGTIDAPVGRDPRNRKRMAVADGGREAITDFTVIERLGDASLLAVRLRSGRTHQVRVHLAYIGHPVLGDSVYGHGKTELQRLALHATQLRFIHPADGVSRTFDSAPPPELAAFLMALRERRVP